MTMLKASLDRLLSTLNPNDTWVPCPACGKDWNKLRKCDYWNGEYVETSYLCVQCAESPRSLEWLQSTYPVPGAVVFVKLECHTVKDEKIILCYMGTVNCSGMMFRIDKMPFGEDTSAHLKVTFARDQDNPVYKNNMLAVWFYLKEKFEQGEDPSIKKPESWNIITPHRKFNR